MNDFLVNGGIPVNLYSNMLIFGYSNKSFKLDEDLLEAMTIFYFNVSHSNPQDQKLEYEFGNELIFNSMQKRRNSPRDQSLTKLLKSPAIMACGVSSSRKQKSFSKTKETETIFLPKKTICWFKSTSNYTTRNPFIKDEIYFDGLSR